MITKSKASSVLDELIKMAIQRIDNTVANGKPQWEGFEMWKQASLDCLEQIYGANHRNVLDFLQIKFSNPTGDPNAQRVTFLVGLMMAKEKLIATLFAVQTYWEEKSKDIIYPIVFISVSEKAMNLAEKLEVFLINLGATPIVVSKKPNLGLTPEAKVNHYLDQCNSGIVIAACDQVLRDGTKISKGNIDNEIGLLTKSPNINNRIIILKEKEVNLSSNHKERVHITFNRSMFSDIYSDLIKDLKGFGFF